MNDITCLVFWVLVEFKVIPDLLNYLNCLFFVEDVILVFFNSKTR